MSEHVNGTHRDQTVLFPNTIDQYVDKENPVRFIDAFVASLNLEKLGFKHSIPAETGRPSYNPSDLLKLYIYGYLNQVRSSRKLVDGTAWESGDSRAEDPPGFVITLSDRLAHQPLRERANSPLHISRD